MTTGEHKGSASQTAKDDGTRSFSVESIYNNGERILPDESITEAHEKDTKDHIWRYEWAAKHIPESASVIDWGCGVGYGSQHIKCREYIGLDISEAAIEYARSKYQGKFSCRDILSGGMKADCGIAFELLEHLEKEPWLVIEELTIQTPMLIFSFPFNEWPGNPHHRWFGLTPAMVYYEIDDAVKIDWSEQKNWAGGINALGIARR